MAWRDSRRNRSRLFLFISSIVLGIAALVAIDSLGDNLRDNIDQQAASLIGADLQISSGKPVSDSIKTLLDSLGDQRSEQRSFASMIYFPASRGTRLVQIKALEGAFPYYGALETTPAAAALQFRNQQAALVDKTLMLQYNARIGDSVKVGNILFAIAGILQKAPGQTGFASSIAPIVYIPLSYLEKTGLSQKGSRISYSYFFKYNRSVNIGKLVTDLEPRLRREGLNYDTVESQKADTGRSFSDLTSFLSLVGFIALLLGCVGVASSIHIYIREKIATIAVLRCLGMKANAAFVIYLLQIAGIGLIGSVAGAILGATIQQVLPGVLKDFLPVDITTALSWPAIGKGILLGMGISVLFALLPLVSLRTISPLNTLRISYEEGVARREPLKVFVYGLIVLFILVFTYFQLHDWRETLFFVAGLGAAFFLLMGLALLVMRLIRRFFPAGWRYVWRQGLANLYRPNNQTAILIVSIGLGTAFICTLFLIQAILINRVSLSASGNQPNMVLFDIQQAQRPGVRDLAKQHQLSVLQEVPIVNMRLESLNGKSAANLPPDSSYARSVFTREYRVTYRDTLTSSEKITKGSWYGRPAGTVGAINISLEQGFARRQRIHIGDTMVFNVQGAEVTTRVGSFREVEWNRVQTNFLVVFPAGVLEEAPQFYVMLTRVSSDQVSARFQQDMVRRFPTVSIIDLGLILSTLDAILDQIAFVIRFMAAFSIITGLIVLIASVLISKYQRIRESVLLRTLGASRKQILAITALEYFFLGVLASGTGVLLSVAASWALARWVFKTPFTASLLPLLLVMIIICLLTIVIGLLNSRAVLNKPPLEVLRQEG